MLLCSLPSFRLQAVLLLLSKRRLPWISLDNLGWQTWKHIIAASERFALNYLAGASNVCQMGLPYNIIISHQKAAHHQKGC